MGAGVVQVQSVYCGGTVQVQPIVVGLSRHQELKAVGYSISEVRREQCMHSSVQVSFSVCTALDALPRE